jgi:DNA polymerase-3 subunit alpha
MKNFPGKSTLKFTLTEPKNKMKISLMTMSSGFEMNDEMVNFLENKPELDVQVITV